MTLDKFELVIGALPVANDNNASFQGSILSIAQPRTDLTLLGRLPAALLSTQGIEEIFPIAFSLTMLANIL
jgi:hypothetical protein